MEKDLVVTVKMPSAELGREAQQFLALAEAYLIDDASMKAMCVADIQRITAKYDAMESLRKRLKNPIDEAAKEIQAVFKPPQDVLMRAKNILRQKLDRFIDMEINEQRRQQEEARKAALVAAEEVAKLAAVEAAQGNREVAEAMQMESGMLVAQAVLAIPEVEKTAGTSRKEIWSAVCEDKMALVKAVAEGKAPLALLDVNETVLNQQARSLRAELHYPGCKVSQTFASSIRR